MIQRHKFITVKDNDRERIFVFPECIYHADMMEMIPMSQLVDSEGNPGNHLFHVEAIRAGFLVDGVCHGASESLGLRADKKKDTALLHGSLNRHQYMVLNKVGGNEEFFFLFPDDIEPNEYLSDIIAGAKQYTSFSNWIRPFWDKIVVSGGYYLDGRCFENPAMRNIKSRGKRDVHLLWEEGDEHAQAEG